MATKTIFDFDPEGNVVITVQGAKGKSCKDLTASVEKALGKVVSDVPTKEMKEEETRDNIHQSAR